MPEEFSETLVDDLAAKLLIGLTREENKTVLDEFAIIKANFDLINKIPNIKDVEPQTFALDYSAVIVNDDQVFASIPVTDLLKNSDQTEGREIEVPKVVGE